MAIIRMWTFILVFVITSCAAQQIRSSYQIYPVRAPSSATSFSKLGGEHSQLVMDSYRKDKDAPIRLTASDGTGIDLSSLRVRTIIDGPLAFTELTMRFHNPRKRELEGRFEISLPDSARVARLAMKVGTTWQEAEVISRRRAHEVYESYLHQKADPVLLEASAGNRFRARVYPIPAKADKEIIISYSEEIPASGDYELFLSGLPSMQTFDVDVHRGERRERYVKHDFVSPKNLVISGDVTTPHAYRAGELVMMHWVPEAKASADLPTSLTVLVDSSASSAGVYGLQVRSMQALAAALAEAYGEKVQLVVACYDNQVQPIYQGLAKDYGVAQSEALLAHGAMGASNLAAALRWAQGKGERLLLLGDGIATTGHRSYEELAAIDELRGPGRIDALSLSSVRDAEFLNKLTQEAVMRGGVVLAASQSPAQWAKELGLSAPQDLRIEVSGASWVWPQTLRPVRAGEAVIAFAKFEAQGAARLDSIRLDLSAQGEASELVMSVRDGEEALIQRQWAKTQLESLAELQSVTYRESRRKQIEALSHRFRVLTPDTALIMLETEYDYQVHGIDRNDTGDVLTVDATGLRRLRRRADGGGDDDWLQILGQPFGKSEVADGAGAVTLVDADARGASSRSKMTGTVRDKDNGQALIGVTVVATSLERKDNYNAITDASGHFALSDLPAGTYELLLIYGDTKAKYSDIKLADDKTAQIFAKLDLGKLGGEVNLIKGRALIDAARTTQGVTIDRDYTRNIPIPGRTFESALQSVAGAQNESVGVSFSGSTSLEQQYLVDGVNTTGLSYGSEGSPRVSSSQPPSAKAKKESAEIRDFRRIRSLLKKGALSRGLGLSLRWYASSPTNLLAVTALGEAFLANGHYKLAARAFASILDLYPSRADMHRVAAAYLSRLGDSHAELRLDALRFANQARPDHPHGIRLLALEMAAIGQEKEAMLLLLRALEESDDQVGRFAHIRDLFRYELGIIAAAWLRREPASVKLIKDLLDDQGIMVPMEIQNYAVLSWESDVSRLDLQAHGKGPGEVKGRRFDVGDIGYGPEAILLEEPASDDLRFSVDFADQAMMGYAFAELQLISLDASGKLSVDTRPLVVLDPHESVAMGGF